jgi:hypothetical protein
MTKRTNEWMWATRKPLSVEPCIEHHDRLADLILFLHAHRDSFASVQHRSMIPTPEDFSFMQGGFGVAPSQIHRHLEMRPSPSLAAASARGGNERPGT